MVELALTMKVKLTANKHESEALNRLCDNYTSCCNEVSDWIGEHHTLSQRKINEAVYHPLRLDTRRAVPKRDVRYSSGIPFHWAFTLILPPMTGRLNIPVLDE